MSHILEDNPKLIQTNSKELSTLTEKENKSSEEEEKKVVIHCTTDKTINTKLANVSKIITTEFIPLKVAEFLSVVDLINLAIEVHSILPLIKLIPKNRELKLNSETQLLQAATIPGIENLFIKLTQFKTWPLLVSFTNLKKLTLKANGYLSSDFKALLFMPKLEVLHLIGINISENESKILFQITSLRELTIELRNINSFIIDKELTQMVWLKKLALKHIGYSYSVGIVTKELSTKRLTQTLSNLINLTSLTIDIQYFGTSEQMTLLGEYKFLEELSLGSIVLKEDDLKQIGKLTTLSKLSLVNCPSITPLFNLTEMRELNLGDSSQVNDDDLYIIAKFTKLEKLSLTHSMITTINPLAELSHLTHLRLSSCKQIAAEGMFTISKFSQLSSLNLNKTFITTDVIEYLSEMKYLTRLEIIPATEVNSIRGEKPFITHLAKLKTLIHLNLTFLDPTNEELKTIGSLTNLRFLSIPIYNSAEDEYYDDIGLAYLSNLTELLKLEISNNNKITTSGLKLCLPCFKYLTVLTLNICSNLDTRIFEVLRDMPNLKEVSLDDIGTVVRSFNIWNNEYLTFEQARPDVEVSGLFPPEPAYT
jgi:hypothetical protein